LCSQFAKSFSVIFQSCIFQTHSFLCPSFLGRAFSALPYETTAVTYADRVAVQLASEYVSQCVSGCAQVSADAYNYVMTRLVAAAAAADWLYTPTRDSHK